MKACGFRFEGRFGKPPVGMRRGKKYTLSTRCDAATVASTVEPGAYHNVGISGCLYSIDVELDALGVPCVVAVTAMKA